jgi:chromosome segregation ATPase
LEKKISGLKEFQDKNEDLINSQKDQIFRLERELSKIKEKAKELEDDLDEAENGRMNIEQKYKQLTFDYNRVKGKADKLSEDIQVIENASQKNVAKPKVRRHISLMSELEEFSMEITENTSQPKFFLSSPTNSNRLLVTVPVQVACILPKRVLNKRKNPLEEYFTLVRFK